jgi:hypothetical protein
VQSAIVTAFVLKDSNSLRSLIDDKFILVRADGSSMGRQEFIHSFDMFGPDDGLSLMLVHESHTDHKDVVIVRGTSMNQWLEGDMLVRAKTPYTDTYQKKNGEWVLVSSYINDIGEQYYARGDTAGIWAAITERYRTLDRSTQQKDLCTHLSLKTNDFSTLDQYGNRASPQFMRNRSRILFNAMRDSIQVNNQVERLEFAEDTVKAIVLQTFKRNQVMAGNKVRRVESSARQRESWMLTREGWKLVFVDQVKPLTRVVDGIPTDPAKPFNPNDPAFKNR